MADTIKTPETPPVHTVFTLGQAAAELGISKSTIHAALKRGTLSAPKVDGKYQIQAAELFRVYKKKQPKAPESEPVIGGLALVEQAKLEMRLEAAHREIGILEGHLADSNDQRDSWREELKKEQERSSQLMLGFERQAMSEPLPEEVLEPESTKSRAYMPWILGVAVVAILALIADRLALFDGLV